MSDPDASRSERLRRLAEMNRGPLNAREEAGRLAAEVRRRRARSEQEGAAPSAAVYCRSPIRPSVGLEVPRQPAPTGIGAASQPLCGTIVDHACHGPAFAVRMCDDVLERVGASRGERIDAIGRLQRCAWPDAEAGDDAGDCGTAAFLDIETGGLGDAVVFLVGLLRLSADGATLTQYLARDYSEEAAVAALSAEALALSRLLVTFNGKSFDMPMLKARAARYRIAIPEPEAHVDLLHICRRAWRGELPNFRLQTLESRICGRWRPDDIPGCEVPDVYHAYVRTGSTDDIARVLRHNADDLATLAELALRLPA